MTADLTRLLVALGIGLLLGLERERHKGEGPSRNSSGIRTFALVGLLGGIAAAIGNALIIAAGALIIGASTMVAYWRGDRADPGITTEVALVVSYALGVLALRDPDLAAAAGVSATAVLAFRTRLHSLARDALSQQEVLDGLLLAVAAVVVLPVLPDHSVGPFGAINPARVWRLVVLVMAVGIAGHLGTRFFGSRFGIPLAGLAGGLVSNTATIGSMGALARREPQLVPAAASAAMLGAFASLVQLTLVVGAADVRVLQAVRVPLIAAGIAAGASALVLSLHSLRAPTATEAPNTPSVDLTSAIAFAGVVTVTLVVVAALHHWLGERGVLIGATLGGAADVHAAAISAASLAARGELPPPSAALPILAALTANSAVKVGIAFTSGPRSYSGRVAIGLALLVSTAWIAALF